MTSSEITGNTTTEDVGGGEPPWLYPLIKRTLWRAVFVAGVVAVFLWVVNKASDLLVIFIVSCFLALAILPGVDKLVHHRGWKRGIATISVIGGLMLSVVAFVAFLIPAMADVVGKAGQEVPAWLESLRSTGLPIPALQETNDQLVADFEAWLKKEGGTHVLDVAGSSVGLIAKLFLTLVFTIVIATSEPNLLRAILGKLSPRNQQRFIDAWDTAIEQTGGYFYSRLLLMVITSTSTFIVMVILGMPVLFAVPLAVLGAFFVEFIPLVGGYIGISLPVIFMLVEKGWVRAVILLAWALIYQQIHDYYLSPRISSKTMAISTGVALGSALLGAAIAGPLGALFAMPVAGMITSFLARYAPPRPIVVSSSSLNEPGSAKTSAPVASAVAAPAGQSDPDGS